MPLYYVGLSVMPKSFRPIDHTTTCSVYNNGKYKISIILFPAPFEIIKYLQLHYSFESVIISMKCAYICAVSQFSFWTLRLVVSE